MSFKGCIIKPKLNHKGGWLITVAIQDFLIKNKGKVKFLYNRCLDIYFVLILKLDTKTKHKQQSTKQPKMYLRIK